MVLLPAAAALDSDVQYCGSVITPACQRALYHIPRGTYNTSANNLAIVALGKTGYYQPDLDTYYVTFDPRVPNGTRPVFVSVDGGEGPTDSVTAATNEAELDTEVVIPLIYPQTTSYYSLDYTPTTSSSFLDGNITSLTPLLDGETIRWRP